VADVADAAADEVNKNSKQDKQKEVTNMKRSGSTTTFTLVCVAVLLASYGIGLGIREIRFRNAGVKTSGKTEKSINQAQSKPQVTTQNAPSPEGGQPDATFFDEDRRGGMQDDEMGGRGRFNENMSDEDRSQMRRGRGRRGMDFENLSDEERAAWEEQRQQMMERFQNMTDEERAQFRGGRGGRSRGGMPEFGAGENNLGSEANESEPGQNNIQSEDDGYGYQENESQVEDEDFGQEDTDNDIE
jgi:hypothetical protein